MQKDSFREYSIIVMNDVSTVFWKNLNNSLSVSNYIDVTINSEYIHIYI